LNLTSPLAYICSSIVASCVDYIAQNIADLPFILVRKDGNILKSGNFYRLFERPNELYSIREILEYTVKDYYIYGASFWIKEYNINGSVKSLQYVKISNTELITNENKNFIGIRYKDKEYYSNELVKFLSYSPGEELCRSKLESVLLPVTYDRNLVNRLIYTDKNFGIIHPVISPAGGNLNEIQIKNLKVDMLNQIRSSPEIPIIMTAPVDIKNLGSDTERDVDKEREFLRKEVTSKILGVPNLGSYSNQESVELSAFINTILPLARFIEERINYDLINTQDRSVKFKFEIKKSDKYRKFLADILRAETLLVERGIMTRDELRELLDKANIQNGEIPLLLTNLTEMLNHKETDNQNDGLKSLREKIITAIEESQKLEDYFNKRISLSEIKNYYTTLLDLPAIHSTLVASKGEAEADKLENILKQYFLEYLVSCKTKDEFIVGLKKFLEKNFV